MTDNQVIINQYNGNGIFILAGIIIVLYLVYKLYKSRQSNSINTKIK